MGGFPRTRKGAPATPAGQKVVLLFSTARRAGTDTPARPRRARKASGRKGLFFARGDGWKDRSSGKRKGEESVVPTPFCIRCSFSAGRNATESLAAQSGSARKSALDGRGWGGGRCPFRGAIEIGWGGMGDACELSVQRECAKIQGEKNKTKNGQLVRCWVDEAELIQSLKLDF